MKNELQSINWHDSRIHGFEFIRNRDSIVLEGRLILDVDYIVEWVETKNGPCQFKVTPADVVFYDVTHLVLHVDFATNLTAISTLSVDDVARKEVGKFGDAPLYEWTICIGWPMDSYIRFKATRFLLKRRKRPILTKSQVLPRSKR